MGLRVLALLLAAGCGPVAYVQQVTFGADGAVEAARAAHADKYSPYWFTRATQYLHMAREVAAHADYQGANRFGRLAEEAAAKAKEEAELGARDPAKLPYLDAKTGRSGIVNDTAAPPLRGDENPGPPAPTHLPEPGPAKDHP